MTQMIFKSNQKHGFAVKYSPYREDYLAYVANDNYGIQGRGTMFILKMMENKILEPTVIIPWADTIFDMTWCEINPNVCLTASGDGSVQLWNLSSPEKPMQVLHEHAKEVYSIQWSLMSHDKWFVTASWDGTAKVWAIDYPASVLTFSGHQDMVYCATFAPFTAGCIATGSGDKTLKVWSMKSPLVGFVNIVHPSEVLSCDWNKYDQNILATGAGDGALRIWDLRFPQQPVAELFGHKNAIKNIKFSPHPIWKNVIATASYDRTTRLWDYSKTSNELEVIDQHTEFVYGLDFSLHRDGELADCSFDETICIYRPPSLQAHL